MAAPENEIIVDVGRTLVGELAPKELPLFHPVSEAFLKQSTHPGQTGWRRADLLGFGAGTAVLLTPIVLTALTNVAIFLAQEVGKSIAGATAAMVTEQVKRMFRHGVDKDSPAIILQTSQLAEVRRIALLTSKEFELGDARATQLADALVGQLVVDGHV
jgi:hypothetical protein